MSAQMPITRFGFAVFDGLEVRRGREGEGGGGDKVKHGGSRERSKRAPMATEASVSCVHSKVPNMFYFPLGACVLICFLSFLLSLCLSVSLVPL